MATQTLATADGLMKDIYLDLVTEQVNYKTYMLDKVERDSTQVDHLGRKATFSVESAANPARGAMADGGTLVTPGKESYAAGTVFIKYFNAGFEISDAAAKQAKGKGVQGVTSLLDRGVKNVVKVMKKNLNRVVFGDGTGLLGSVTAGAGPVNTITLDTVQYMKVGDPIDVLTRSNGAVVGAGRNVTARSPSGKTITFDGAAITVTTNEGVYLAGSYGLEFDGLRNISAPGRSLHGIDSSVAGNEYWNGNQIAAAAPGNTAIAGESLFEQLDDTVGGNGQGEIELHLTTRGVRRRLADTYQSQKRFNDAKAVDVHGGYSAIFVNEKPVIFDDDCPKGWSFGLPDMDIFTWHEVAAPDWLESEDGTVWHLAVTGSAGARRAAWQAWYVWYAALACEGPNRTGQIIRCADDNAS